MSEPSKLNVQEITDRIRAQATKLYASLPEGSSVIQSPALPRVGTLPDWAPPAASKPVDAKAGRLKNILERAAKKLEVSRYIPKFLRRFFRKQGGYNQLIIEAISVLTAVTDDLNKRLCQIAASVDSQSSWLTALSKIRKLDEAWMEASNAIVSSVAQSRGKIVSLSKDLSALQEKSAEFDAWHAPLRNIGEHVRNLQTQVDSILTNLRDFRIRLEATHREAASSTAGLDEARRLGARLDERIVAEGSFLKSELHLLNRKLLQLQTFEKGKESEVPAAVSQGQHNLDAFYVAFENRFRGDRQLVKDRQQVYLPYLRFLECSGEDKAILDLGCGRGEWLELLQENGFSCAGVDSNAIMVAQCQERQLPAIEKDVLSFLGEQKDGVYGAVTAFHLLEHLPPIILLDLVKEVFRVLQAGGIAIFETPNPDNLLVGSNRFYLDPTHVRPLPKPLLEFSLILAGFKKVEIRSLQPDAPVDFDKECPKLEEFINRMFFGDQDYCAIAHK